MEESKDYAGALRTYEPCTDDLVLRIGMLSRCYAPAKEILIRRRVSLEKEVNASFARGVEPELALTRFLVSINVALQDEERSVQLFDLSLSKGFRVTAKELQEAIWMELTERRRYADALRWDTAPMAQVSEDLALVRPAPKRDPELANPQVIWLMFRKAVILAEAQAGTGRSDEAKATLEAALGVFIAVEGFVFISQRMKRAENDQLVAWSLGQADKRLSAGDAGMVRKRLSEEHVVGH